MASDLHEALVMSLNADQRGFRRAVRAAMGDEEYQDQPLARSRRRPDAYRIEPDTVRVYEVEVGHPLDERAIFEYADWWFYMDCADWEFCLTVVDRWGSEHEVDLCTWWYRKERWRGSQCRKAVA